MELLPTRLNKRKLHIEFYHQKHFDRCYKKKVPQGRLSKFVRYFFETNFYDLFKKYPGGFSDVFFPDVGYCYLFNLGTPFTVQLEETYSVRQDGFLPGLSTSVINYFEANKVFGIRFRVSPLQLERQIDFSEYRNFIFPLSYLIERPVVKKLKDAVSFDQRVEILTRHYNKILDRSSTSAPPNVVVDVMSYWEETCFQKKHGVGAHRVNERTLDKFFRTATGYSTKDAFRLMKIRAAVADLVANPSAFDFSLYHFSDFDDFMKSFEGFISHPIYDVHLHTFNRFLNKVRKK